MKKIIWQVMETNWVAVFHRKIRKFLSDKKILEQTSMK